MADPGQWLSKQERRLIRQHYEHGGVARCQAMGVDRSYHTIYSCARRCGLDTRWQQKKYRWSDGQSYTAGTLAKMHGLYKATVYYRLKKRGMSIHEALGVEGSE